MEVPERLERLCEGMRQEFGAERFYVIDIEEEQRYGEAGTVVFGMRHAAAPPLLVRLRVAKELQDAIQQAVGVEVFTDPFDEVEYLFDRYLRSYIASHGGIVTPVKIEEPLGKLWIHMDGACSGCPASIATLKLGIERTLKKHLPWLKHVEAINEAEEPDFGIALDFSVSAIGSTTEEQP